MSYAVSKILRRIKVFIYLVYVGNAELEHSCDMRGVCGSDRAASCKLKIVLMIIFKAFAQFDVISHIEIIKCDHM